MTAFNAQEFRAHLAQYGGVAQDNYFDVVFALPEKLLKSSGIWDADQKLTFRAHMTDMPARNLETMDRRYAGPMRNIPLGHTYTTLQLHIIEGADRKSRQIMDAWQTLIMDDKNGWSVPFYNEIVADYIELRITEVHLSKMKPPHNSLQPPCTDSMKHSLLLLVQVNCLGIQKVK
jgi:hypothetical protein